MATGTILSLALLTQLVGCKSSKSSSGSSTPTSVTLSGKVTYVRVPLLTDSNGVPTGLETNTANFKDLPLRGAQVYAFQSTDETNPDGTKVKVWKTVGTALTDSTGAYSLVLESGKDTYVEVRSIFQDGNILVRVLGDPSGINSSLSQVDRVIYSARKGADGSSPAGNPTPGTNATANATINFDLGLTDKLWLAPSSELKPEQATQETSGTGSRPFAIGDTIYSFGTSFLDSTNHAPATLDLHYRPGVSNPRGSFIEFDRSKFPLAASPAENSVHYFGSLQGSATDDDAWDEGVLLPLFARFFLYDQGQTTQFPPCAMLTDLSPDLAAVEGLAPAMAATALKSPYLANTSSSGIQVTDIRDLTGLPASKQTPYSAPDLAAMAWEISLKANGIQSPGTSTTWATLNPAAIKRFFTLISPSDKTDVSSIYQQLGRLKEAKSTSEPVDLAAIFTDANLTALTAPFGIAWPRPTTPPLSTFVTDWGANPNSSALTPFAFTMANAVQVRGAYPNVSEGEIGFARFTLSADTAYDLRVVSSTGALPAGSSIQVRLPTGGLQPLRFSGDPSAPTVRVVLYGTSTSPVVYPVILQILSPSAVLPDFTATVQLTVAN